MNTTSLTLLEALRRPGDQHAWLRFVQLYTPLLYHWARGVGLQQADAEDLVQEVFVMLLRKLPEFQYERNERTGSFRNWLRVVTLNKWRERCRRKALEPVADNDRVNDAAASCEMAVFEEAEYCQQLVRRALKLIQPEFSTAAWRAFHEHVVVGRDAAEVADALGIRIGTVYAAKSRVLTRLRRELAGLID